MIKVRVPGSISNFGSGFDSLGMAISFYNTFKFEKSEKFEINSKYKVLDIEDHPTIKALKYLGEKYKVDVKSSVTIEGNIPPTRGLGSSASCYIAGLIGGAHLSKLRINKSEIYEMATVLEGHPDNVAPALFGGLQISAIIENIPINQKIEFCDQLKLYAFIPKEEVSTKLARECLDKRINLNDATYNISRIALLVNALNLKDYKFLKESFNDKLHQKHRIKLIPNGEEIISWVNNNCKYGGFISGAGSTIIGIHDKKDKGLLEKFYKDTNIDINKCSSYKIELDKAGAKLI